MSIFRSSYLAYGIRLPDEGSLYDAQEVIEQTLSVSTVKEACPDVGHFTAGAYDEHSLYLVTEFHAANYEPTWINVDWDLQQSWDRQLRRALEVLGWTRVLETFEPGWFVIKSEC